MEHFEVHKENLEDLIMELNNKGPTIFDGLETKQKKARGITMDDIGLIDEISGLNEFLENVMQTQRFSETTKDKIRARMNVYQGSKPKQIAMNEISMAIFGDNR